MNYRITTYSDELYHYGVKGMHWGIRRYQNYDGTRIGTGGAPVTRASAKVKNAYRKSVSGGQGGKATGMERVAATANPGGKSGLFDRTIKKGKGKENTSPAEEISKSVRDASRDAKPLVDIAEKHDPKTKAAREDLSKKAQKMSDKELRDQINRIRMEREYVDLKSSDINTGYDKAREILEIAGDVASIAVSIATLIAIVSKLKHEDLDPDTAAFIEDFTNVLAQDGITLDGVDLDYLEHHGIKGMKWGVRRYQNYDGTRIGGGGSKASNSFRNSIVGGQGGKAIGTERIATKSPFFKNKGEKVFDRNRKRGGLARTAKEEKELFRQNLVKDTASVDYSKMEKSREEFNNLASELGSDYPKAYEQMLNDKSNRSKIYEDTISYLEKEFKTDRNDPDFYASVSGDEEWLREGIDHAIDKNLPKDVVDKTAKMFKAGDEFFGESERIANSIASKYSDVTLRDLEVAKTSSGYTYDVRDKKGATANGSEVAKYYLTTGHDYSWEAYQYKHFDDYWVRDVEQRYTLEDALCDEIITKERKRAGITKVTDKA